MSFRRLLVIAAIVAALYFGYDYFMRFTQEQVELREKAAQKKEGPEEVVDPVSSTAQRRRASEQAVDAANKKPSE